VISLQAGLTAAETHHEHFELALHVFSAEIASHSLSCFKMAGTSGFLSSLGKLEHEKTAEGSLAASAGFLHAALTAADLHQEHLAALHVPSSL